MTLQASGPIDFSDINVELGLAGNTANSALGSAAFRGLAGVPSGAIRLGADFYGKSNFTAINGGVYDDTRFDSTSPRMTFKTNGDVTKSGGADEGTDWGTPLVTGAGSGWEIYVHQNSGSGVISGTLDTWLSLSSEREWAMTPAIFGIARDANLTVSFRPAGSGGGATHAGTITFLSDRT